ncbi:MAG: MBL fold metallo-hydrolase [Candidatus Fermentibacteraceae bacterium]
MRTNGSSVNIRRVILGPIETNCWIAGCPETGLAIVVDPGGNTASLGPVMTGMGITALSAVVNTHGHFDHVWGNGELGVPTMIHRLDAPMLSRAHEVAASYGFIITPPPAPSRLLDDADEIRVGNLCFTVIHTPGHSPGSICLLGHGLLFSGDTVFQGSIGRTDLPGGDYRQIALSIRERIIPLPETLRVLPGHGPETTLKRETATNPFFPRS